jgi:hypothetical protein
MRYGALRPRRQQLYTHHSEYFICHKVAEGYNAVLVTLAALVCGEIYFRVSCLVERILSCQERQFYELVVKAGPILTICKR